MRTLKVFTGINLAMMLLVLAIAGMQVAQAQPQTAVYFDSGGDRLVVANGGEIQAESGSTLDLQGGIVLAQQSETVTASFVITPTGSYIVLTSGAPYTSSTSTPIITSTATTGQIIYVRNGNASDALILDGTGGTLECKANITLAASDVQPFIFNGTDWNCAAGLGDNS